MQGATNSNRMMEGIPVFRAGGGGGSLIPTFLCFIFIHFVSDGLDDPLFKTIVCGGFSRGLLCFACCGSPPRVGPGRCRGVTTLINCLLSPVCMASCLPCRHVLRGFRVVGWQRKTEGGSWRGEVCSGVVSPVCLNNSVAVSNMDHS